MSWPGSLSVSLAITDFRLVDRIPRLCTGEMQARAYGDMSLVGQQAEIAGLYAPNALPGERFNKWRPTT
jgi:hypothetical protein